MTSHPNSPRQPPEPSEPPRPPTPLHPRRGALANIFSILDHNEGRNATFEERTALINAALLPAAPEPSTSCSICITAIPPRSLTAVALPCSHIFHQSCILEWLRTHNTCPLCRSPLFEEPAPATATPDAPPATPSGFEDALDVVVPVYSPSFVLHRSVEGPRAAPLFLTPASHAQAESLDARWTAHHARHTVAVEAAGMLTASVTTFFFGIREVVDERRREELDRAMYGMLCVAERLDGREVEAEVVFEWLVTAGMEEVGILRRRRRQRGLRGIVGRVFRRVLGREVGGTLPDQSVDAVRDLARRMVNSQSG